MTATNRRNRLIRWRFLLVALAMCALAASAPAQRSAGEAEFAAAVAAAEAGRLEPVQQARLRAHPAFGWLEYAALRRDFGDSAVAALDATVPLWAIASSDATLPAVQEAVRRARETLREAEITADGIDLDGADLGRNTLTWTYMVHDNPLNDDTLSALSLPGVFR